MHMKYNVYEVCELLLFVFDMGYDQKKYSFFSSNYEQGGVINTSQNTTTLSFGIHLARCSGGSVIITVM